MPNALDRAMSVDPEFRDLCFLLYGDGVDPERVWEDTFAKMSPDASEVSAPGRKPRDWTKALSRASNVVGITAGGAALLPTLRDPRLAEGGRVSRQVQAAAQRTTERIGRSRMGAKYLAFADRPKVKPRLAAGAALLQLSNLGGDAVTSRVLARQQRKAKSGVSKADEVEWSGEFSKLDDEKRLAFGWASVISVGGVPVVDSQADYIHPDDLEDAAYRYVIKSRKGGDMHRRTVGEAGDEPYHAADLVESFVLTPEKIEKMGLPKDTKTGWWVGFKIRDDDTWSAIKKDERTGFSIHGKGHRREVDYDEVMAGA